MFLVIHLCSYSESEYILISYPSVPISVIEKRFILFHDPFYCVHLIFFYVFHIMWSDAVMTVKKINFIYVSSVLVNSCNAGFVGIIREDQV